MRVGQGYDAHRLVPGRKLVLGGVEVPFELGLAGHSDGDVLTHAVIDALLGAAALGDIGAHFPSTDEQYLGAASTDLLTDAVALLRRSGWRVVNLDATIVAERPRLAPFIPRMQERLATALGVAVDCVSVKATTTDGLGFEGRGEGISAYAVASVQEQGTA